MHRLVSPKFRFPAITYIFPPPLSFLKAQEAIARIKAPQGESQPSTDVELFVSTERILVLNTDLQEIMMDHSLRTISYIADIGDIVVLMARRNRSPSSPLSEDGSGGGNGAMAADLAAKRQQQKMVCACVCARAFVSLLFVSFFLVSWFYVSLFVSLYGYLFLCVFVCFFVFVCLFLCLFVSLLVSLLVSLFVLKPFKFTPAGLSRI